MKYDLKCVTPTEFKRHRGLKRFYRYVMPNGIEYKKNAFRHDISVEYN